MFEPHWRAPLVLSAKVFAARIRRIAEEDEDALDHAGLTFTLHALVCRQLDNDHEHQLCLAYAQGKCVVLSRIDDAVERSDSSGLVARWTSRRNIGDRFHLIGRSEVEGIIPARLIATLRRFPPFCPLRFIAGSLATAVSHEQFSSETDGPTNHNDPAMVMVAV